MYKKLRPLAIQHYIKLARQQKEMISFAAGLPDLSVLPLTQLKSCYQEIMLSGERDFQYQAPRDTLKEKIQQLMQARGLSCKPQEIFITSGAQQGIALTASLWFKHGASLMVNDFVYPGFLHVANYYDMHYLSIPSIFQEGMDLESLEYVLKREAVLPYLYIVCNGNNPQGYSCSASWRQALARLAEKYQFIIIEDDPYGYLNFSDEQFLPMRAYTNKAVYISSFSKVIAPAVRVGWMVADADIITSLEHIKDMDDLYLSNPNQAAVDRFLEKHDLHEIVKPQLALYQSKMDCMLEAIKTHFKVPYQVFKPEHGMFIWLEFDGIDIEQQQEILFEKAGVLFIPGSAFSAVPEVKKQAIRLGFTLPSHEEIQTGIARLAEAIHQSV